MYCVRFYECGLEESYRIKWFDLRQFNNDQNKLETALAKYWAQQNRAGNHLVIFATPSPEIAYHNNPFSIGEFDALTDAEFEKAWEGFEFPIINIVEKRP